MTVKLNILHLSKQGPPYYFPGIDLYVFGLSTIIFSAFVTSPVEMVISTQLNKESVKKVMGALFKD
jgi:hypothetical protein